MKTFKRVAIVLRFWLLVLGSFAYGRLGDDENMIGEEPPVIEEIGGRQLSRCSHHCHACTKLGIEGCFMSEWFPGEGCNRELCVTRAEMSEPRYGSGVRYMDGKHFEWKCGKCSSSTKAHPVPSPPPSCDGSKCHKCTKNGVYGCYKSEYLSNEGKYWWCNRSRCLTSADMKLPRYGYGFNGSGHYFSWECGTCNEM